MKHSLSSGIGKIYKWYTIYRLENTPMTLIFADLKKKGAMHVTNQGSQQLIIKLILLKRKNGHKNTLHLLSG